MNANDLDTPINDFLERKFAPRFPTSRILGDMSPAPSNTPECCESVGIKFCHAECRRMQGHQYCWWPFLSPESAIVESAHSMRWLVSLL